jgi:hypothetical protein
MAMSVQTTFSRDPAIGYAGMLDSNVTHDILTMVNAEASASIAFGRAVKFKDTVTTDKDAVLPKAQADKLIGIVVHSHNYAAAWTDVTSNTTYGELDSVGIKPTGMLNVLRRGRILVVCEDGCEAGDKLYVRVVSAEDGTEFYGGLNNAADASDMIDATASGTWLTSCAAGGLAWLDVNF